MASSAAWVERHRATIEVAIGKAIKTSYMNWRPSVEILKEEGLQVDGSKDSSFDSTLDVVDDFEVIFIQVLLHKIYINLNQNLWISC